MPAIKHQRPVRSFNTGGVFMIGLFTAAILGVIVILNLMATPLYFLGGLLFHALFGLLSQALEGWLGKEALVGSGEPILSLWQFWLLTTLAILAPIVSAFVSQRAELASGGAAIAEMIGATKAVHGTGDPTKSRFLEVVDELSKSIGMPAPRAFVMEKEQGINAFAAGYAEDDMVLAVSRGALLRLNREELRGVVAHELAHILNGETRSSLVLIPLLAGLVSIAKVGRSLTHFEWMQDLGKGGLIMLQMFFRGPALIFSFVVGYLLRIVGSIGVLFASLIKTLYARQLVFLADQSAVEITDSVDGIGGALRKVGGLAQDDPQRSNIHVNLVEILSHLFLCEVRDENERDLLPAQPALTERISRIYFGKRDFLPAPIISVPADELKAQAARLAAIRAEQAASLDAASGPTASAEVLPEVIGIVSNARHDVLSRTAAYELPPEIDGALGNPDDAALVFLALLIEDDEAWSRDGDALRSNFGSEAVARIDQYRTALSRLPPGRMVSLVEDALPQLRALERQASQRLLETAHHLIVADGRVTFHEFLLHTALTYGVSEREPQANGTLHLHQLPREAEIVLSLIAYLRSPRDPENAYLASAVPEVYHFVPGDRIDLGEVSDALERLAELAAQGKRTLIRLAEGITFFQGITNWEAASVLRLLCLVLAQPLPDQLQLQEPAREADTTAI